MTGGRPRWLALLALTAVYALALGSAAPLDLALGAVVAVAALGVTHRLRGPRGPTSAALVRRVASAPRFALAILADIASGTWVVTRAVLGRQPPAAGMVRVPIGERSELGLVVTALAITLSPGAALVDIDREEGTMLVHVIDATNPDATRERYRRLYEDHQRDVAP